MSVMQWTTRTSPRACRSPKNHASSSSIAIRLTTWNRPSAAGDDFVEKLQSRMRRRSGGKLFGANRWGHVTRVPYELFSLVLILIILTVYMLLLPVARIAAPESTSPPPQPENGASQGDGER